MKLPLAFKETIEHLNQLQGVGERTAFRYALQMADWTKEELLQFSNILGELSQIQYCRECGVFSDEVVCALCNNPKRRENSQICVVERLTDLLAIERSGQFSGVFHILGGVLNPLAGLGPQNLRIQELIQRVEHYKFQEIILAINPSLEGDATCAYLKDIVPDFVSVKRIGFGVPMGGNLEYLDPLTIMKAFENKSNF